MPLTIMAISSAAEQMRTPSSLTTTFDPIFTVDLRGEKLFGVGEAGGVIFRSFGFMV